LDGIRGIGPDLCAKNRPLAECRWIAFSSAGGNSGALLPITVALPFVRYDDCSLMSAVIALVEYKPRRISQYRSHNRWAKSGSCRSRGYQ
jgi:hypothetical protein